MTTVVKLQDVSYTYPSDEVVKPAVSHVSYSVEQGEWIAIVGHNGSGKSTMAKLINGLLFPSEGVVELFGQPLNEDTLWESRSQLGMVFQNPDNQFVGATVQDDVAFALENNGIVYEDMVERVHSALQQVQMADFLNQEPHHLSGGQKQRVAIAGAIAMRPKLLILDEATSMLDPQGRREVIQTLQMLRESSEVTVLSITHDLEEAMLADRVIVMNGGEKFLEGRPEEVFANREQITKLGLDLPFAANVANLLRARGVDVPATIMSEKELVEALWTLHSDK
ncbi:energy-coupling factor ABC transporter ATP-binding protein [Chryseomicrobium aureum]|uniref:energy-coupling factor ABC transporter ATP-binding protein n=1 Tax=Chryseomicrobium aureum TaxID=1441723 RepID=UPI00195C6E40|nr:energy-coupling factor ABC transporter ATP-binding protein [Chryseomicrobium aureum]MBM7707546.1 energy-coupling factor transport system ATP-binding protein [Chryseomicrobium aureum]